MTRSLLVCWHLLKMWVRKHPLPFARPTKQRVVVGLEIERNFSFATHLKMLFKKRSSPTKNEQKGLDTNASLHVHEQICLLGYYSVRFHHSCEHDNKGETETKII